MNRLNLSPLPCLRLPEGSRGPATSDHHPGFVDDAVVFALLRNPGKPAFTRDVARPALAADELDFAGWHAAAALP